MNIVSRASKTFLIASKRVHAARSYASSSRICQQTEKHATKEAEHGDHHDHEHHDHPMWEDLPFGKRSTGILIFGGGLLAVGLIVGATVFQQKKQGYMK